MGMLERLRASHPDCAITAFDGHYRRIGDDHMHLVDHVVVERAGRRDSLPAAERARRKPLHPKAVEARLSGLIGRFASDGPGSSTPGEPS